MASPEDYRKNADECFRMATSARNDDERRAWLLLAEGWLRMLEGPIPEKRPAAESVRQRARRIRQPERRRAGEQTKGRR
jgi:hypothetical protein